MIRIAVCDDEKIYREKVIEYVKEYFNGRTEECAIKEYSSGHELIDDVDIDVLLLDIEMEGLDGIEIKNILQQKNMDTRILFITSHMENMPDAFGKRVFGFLVKPLIYEEFVKKMDVVIKDWMDDNIFIICKSSEGFLNIRISDIIYIEAEGRYTKVYVQSQEHYIFVQKSFGEWKEELNNHGFFQIHKSFLVNMYYIKFIKQKITMVNGEQLAIGRKYRTELMEQYKEYIWKKGY